MFINKTSVWRTAGLSMAGLLVLLAAAVVSPAPSSAAQLAIGISVRIAPPPLPVYDQPICPGAGYIWTPGYWAYDPDNGYYWVPGTWVLAPAPGLLWTPGYWGWSDGLFFFGTRGTGALTSVSMVESIMASATSAWGMWEAIGGAELSFTTGR